MEIGLRLLAGFLELELDFLYWCFCWVFNKEHL